ncbi:Nif3-like dinuclear metal center hexameric protein [Spiroplasma endosymbiont of Labia minor]|uniref:Nif3-like dinuclear metal center hexameric protein n=1 Tax=Spiroplasma endosymbiont of Labia minor TaxID=3066305 RepID=UPI0030D0BF5F
MVKQNKLIAFLNELFPQNTAAKWDQVGFQIAESFNNVDIDEIKKILVVLDFNREAMDYAIANDINFIISRHPFIFNDMKTEMESPAKKTIYSIAAEAGLQVFSIHTNYDASSNQFLAHFIKNDFGELETYEKFGENNEGSKIKFKSNTKLVTIINKFLEKLKLSNFQTSKNTDLNTEVNEIYFLSGSGSSEMSGLSLKNTTFVTGEAKWNDFVYAQDNFINLITLGHYMENYFIYDIKNKLQKEFKDDLIVETFDIGNQVIYY